MTPTHTAQQVAYLTVRVILPGSADPWEAIEACRLSIDHPDILSAEITGISEN